MVGLGKSGVAATRLLRHDELPVYASDTGKGQRTTRGRRALRALGAEVQLGGHDLTRISRAAAVVVAPGVPPDVPPLAAARAAGLEIYAEVDVGFLALRDTRCIGITGTNGKTTTTSLIAHAMAVRRPSRRDGGQHRPAALRGGARGRPARVAGAGAELVPAARHAAPPSRHRRAHQPGAQPPRPVPLAGGVLRRQGAAVPERGAPTRSGSAMPTTPPCRRWWTRCPARHLRFSIAGPADGWYDRAGASPHARRPALMPRARPAAAGRPQRRQRAGCRARRRSRPAPIPTAWPPASGSFRAIPHRVEPVREVGGVLWINDSKSTNITSTEVAVAALDRPFVLLLGGRHKGEPYTRLAEPLRGRCRAVVAYGEAGGQVVRDLGAALTVVPGGRFRERARDRPPSWPSPATPCCCRPPAPATTCSRTTRSGASDSGPRWRRCERSAAGPPPRGAALGDPAPRGDHARPAGVRRRRHLRRREPGDRARRERGPRLRGAAAERRASSAGSCCSGPRGRTTIAGGRGRGRC